MLTCSAISKYDRTTIRAWCLYDFGNSAFAVLFPSVLSLHFVHGLGGDEQGWGLAVSLSMLAVAITSPFVGGIADHASVRKRMLVLYTLLGLAAVLCVPLLGDGMVGRALAVVVIANFAFEGGIVFYNSYLPVIAPAPVQGRVSAAGYAFGYAGSLVAIGYAAGFRDSLDLVWIALALQWLLAALPGFRILPADGDRSMAVFEAARHGLRTTKQTLRDVWGMKNLRRFLIAYFFYMDGVLTVIAFATLYSRSLGFTTSESMGMLALVQVTALAGSLIMARPTDRMGPKWSVSLLLLWWIGVVVLAYFTTSKLYFTIIAGLAGLGLGSIQAASRAFMSRLIPKGREAELFGFYGLCGRSGAVMGPVLFGTIWKWVGPNEAMVSVAAFYLIGYLLLRPVRDRVPAP